jgi:hypothetical protein
LLGNFGGDGGSLLGGAAEAQAAAELEQAAALAQNAAALQAKLQSADGLAQSLMQLQSMFPGAAAGVEQAISDMSPMVSVWNAQLGEVIEAMAPFFN